MPGLESSQGLALFSAMIAAVLLRGTFLMIAVLRETALAENSHRQQASAQPEFHPRAIQSFPPLRTRTHNVRAARKFLASRSQCNSIWMFSRVQADIHASALEAKP